MKIVHAPRAAVAAAVAVTLAFGGCHFGGETPEPPPPAEGSATLDAAGGIVDGPDGVRLAVPAGALAGPVTLRIARDGGGAPPLPDGIELAGPVYSITPHGEAFEAPVGIRLPVDAARVGARRAFLIKAQPDGEWRVLGPVGAASTRAQQVLGSLSYFAVAMCSDAEVSSATIACPANHELRFELIDGNGALIPLPTDADGYPLPVLTLTQPTQLTLRMRWLRPADPNRIDLLDIGSINQAGILGRAAGITWSPNAPNDLEVTHSVDYALTVDVDPAAVQGASAPAGRVRNLWAHAQYNVPPFGPFRGARWTFESFIPIRIQFVGEMPVIASGPTPDRLAVVENSPFTLGIQASGRGLTTQWRYRTDPADANGTPAEGTNSAASYTSPPAPLAWSGRQYFARLCTTSGNPAVTRCIDSNPVPLTVNPFTEPAVFTQQPRAASIVAGETVDFTAAARGTPAPTLAWVLGWNCSGNPPQCSGTPLLAGPVTSGPLAGATVDLGVAGRLRLTGVPLGADGTSVTALARQPNQPDVPSMSARLTVAAMPEPARITTPLASPRSVVEGDAIEFTVGVSGSAPVDVAWTVDGAPASLGRLTSGRCTGANASRPTNETLRLDGVPLACNGAVVRVAVSNRASAAPFPSSSATLAVTQAVGPPVFTLQPVAQSAAEGGGAVFTAAARGSPAPSIDWLAGSTLLAASGSVDQTGCRFGYSRQGGTLTLIGIGRGCDGLTFVARAANPSGTVDSSAATLRVNVTVPPNAMTATQVLAGDEWSLALRPDRTVWAWGQMQRPDGTVDIARPSSGWALRPVQMYPAVLTDVHAISGWFQGFYALKGTPGSSASRVLYWGQARNAADGRGYDGNGGSGTGTLPTRSQFAAPVEVLERVNGVPRPVDHVCAIAAGAERLLILRALTEARVPTDCNPGSAKTVWMVGSTDARFTGQHSGVAERLGGLPASTAPGTSPPATIYVMQTSSGNGSVAVALEDGRIFALGQNNENGLGLPLPAPASLGGPSGLVQLPTAWGPARSFASNLYLGLFVLRQDGSVAASGYNSRDELGLGAFASAQRVNGPLPLLAETCSATPCTALLANISAITSTRTATTLALQNGRILGWGANVDKLLGTLPITTTQQSYPRPVSLLGGFTALSATGSHALAIGPGQVVWAWGSSSAGGLGDGRTGGSEGVPFIVQH